MRDSVAEAVTALGNGFARDESLRENVDPGPMERALLRLVYRLLFWFVAEDRSVLHPEGTDEQARRRYQEEFSARRLRRAAAGEHTGQRPGDLWASVRRVLDGLGDEKGVPELGLPSLGGIFGETDADQVLRGLVLADEDLLAAVRALAGVQNLETAEFGVICGADYTPQSLVDCLLDSCLDPVLDDAVRGGQEKAKRKKRAAESGESAESDEADEAGEVVKALLSVTVCDPACGFGQFLVAAARRIAKRVAAVREQGPQDGERALEPSGAAFRDALRDVVTNCVYGVDLDETAVELAKASLWLESSAPEKDLSFLDGRVKRGNSLIGATPALIESGIPDSAFKPAEGDDPKWARSLVRANVKPSPGQFTLFSDQAGDNRCERLVADAWCAAFAWAKRRDAPPAVVNRVFADLRERGTSGILPETLTEIERLRGEHGFFHWHLEFPDVFRRGGFSCVLTNPPWDKVDRHGGKVTFGFARASGLYPECAEGLTAPGVTTLRSDQLFAERLRTLTGPAGRAGCIVPTAIALTAGGRYLFGRLMRDGAVMSLYDFDNRGGRFFPSVPAGDRFCLLTLAGEEAGKGPARFAFSLLDTTELGTGEPAENGRSLTLTPEEIALVNPNTASPPAFRNRRDAALTVAIYHRVPVLWNETRADGNPWKLGLETAFFRAAGDSSLFRTQETLQSDGWELAGDVFTRDGERMLPVYESPMAHLFDHRWSSFDGTGNADHHHLTPVEKQDPSVHARPRYWVPEHGPVSARTRGKEVDLPAVAERLAELGWGWDWLCGWRKAAGSADERTAVAAFLPRAAVTESFPLMLPRVVPPFAAALIAVQSSLVFDFVARRKLDDGTIRPAVWKQLPVPAPEMMEAHLPFIVPRVLELVYTSYDMRPLARDLDDEGEPFLWDEERRAGLRAELDAFFFRLYGIDDRDDVNYILETFQTETGAPLVLDAYDRMAAADAADLPYETRLLRQPGHGDRHRPPDQSLPSSEMNGFSLASVTNGWRQVALWGARPRWRREEAGYARTHLRDGAVLR